MSELIHRHPDGSTEGADPRSLSRSILNGAGHEKRPILKAIREKCLDCCNGNDAEVPSALPLDARCGRTGWVPTPSTTALAGNSPAIPRFQRGATGLNSGPPHDSQPRDQSPRVGLAARVRGLPIGSAAGGHSTWMRH
jgi:hypothetical protein